MRRSVCYLLPLFFFWSTTPLPIVSAIDSTSMVQVVKQAGVYSSPDKKCEASLQVSDTGGFLTLSITRKNDKRSLRDIEDVTGVAWFGGKNMVYSVSPIYGKPGIFLFNCDSMRTRQIVKPRTINQAYPHGADYFELQGAVLAAKGTIYFYYAPDVEMVDFRSFRSIESMHQVKLDGTGFKKAEKGTHSPIH